MKKFYSLALTIASFILIIVTVIASILLNVEAFHAAGKSFWDMLITNQTGTFFTIWGYNPLAAAGVTALGILTVITITVARSTAKN